jgi:hypothetical protein
MGIREEGVRGLASYLGVKVTGAPKHSDLETDSCVAEGDGNSATK